MSPTPTEVAREDEMLGFGTRTRWWSKKEWSRWKKQQQRAGHWADARDAPTWQATYVIPAWQTSTTAVVEEVTGPDMPPPPTTTAAVEDARQGALLGEARSSRASAAGEKEREATPTPTFQAGAPTATEEVEAQRETGEMGVTAKRADGGAEASEAAPPSLDTSSESAGLRQVVRGKRARRKTSEVTASRRRGAPAASPFTPRAIAETEDDKGKADEGGTATELHTEAAAAKEPAAKAAAAVALPDDTPLKALLANVAQAPAAAVAVEATAEGAAAKAKASPKPAPPPNKTRSIRAATAAAKKAAEAKAKAKARAKAKGARKAAQKAAS